MQYIKTPSHHVDGFRDSLTCSLEGEKKTLQLTLETVTRRENRRRRSRLLYWAPEAYSSLHRGESESVSCPCGRKKSSNLDNEEIIFIPTKSFLNHLRSRYDAGIYVCISFRKLLRPRNFSINRKPRPIITFFVLWPVPLVVKRWQT